MPDAGSSQAGIENSEILSLGGFTALQVPKGMPSAQMDLTDAEQVCPCLQIVT